MLVVVVVVAVVDVIVLCVDCFLNLDLDLSAADIPGDDIDRSSL